MFLFCQRRKNARCQASRYERSSRPDLIIEVDITSLSTLRENIFAAFGVPEIWRFDGEKMQILRLEKDKYIETPKSLSLPKVTPEKLTVFVNKSETLSRLEWIKEVRDWTKSV